MDGLVFFALGVDLALFLGLDSGLAEEDVRLDVLLGHIEVAEELHLVGVDKEVEAYGKKEVAEGNVEDVLLFFARLKDAPYLLRHLLYLLQVVPQLKLLKADLR